MPILRQDVVLVYEAFAACALPHRPSRQFLFTTARNHLINRVRREQIVPIEAAVDLDALEVAIETPGLHRTVLARDELRRLQLALDRLPPRCREIVIMGQIEGLTGREIAAISKASAEGYSVRNISPKACARLPFLLSP